MFEQLFSRPSTVQQYLSAPALEPRLRYLRHCAAQGATSATLRAIALCQRVIIQSIDVHGANTIRPAQLETAAQVWTGRTPPHHAYKDGQASRVRFVSTATRWLAFLGRLETPPTPTRPWGTCIAEFAEYMRSERGLSPLTVYTRCHRIEEFFTRFCPDVQALRQVTMVEIDQAIAQKGRQDGCARASIRTYAYVLRSFFRYAETRGWCARDLAGGICPPRVYTSEQLPAGPTWDQVQRLCAGAEGDARAQLRDRAILLLFAVYGLRAGEVRRLRLEDLEWDAEAIHVTRSKQQRRIQTYPLVQAVGDAILRYLKTGRPRSAAREIFLSLKAPIRPLGTSAFWQIVNRRLRPLGLSLAHQGPHALRHACATRLLNQGLSMKHIGDHLGHRSPAATSLYAKVDLAGLRQVADFDLTGLL